jgi:hypothetical protein
MDEERGAMALAVGKFIMAFNGADDRLNTLIAAAVSPTDVARGEIVGAANQSLRVKCNVLKALVAHVAGKEASASFEPLAERLERINTVRNDLAHREYWHDLEGKLRQRRPRLTDKGYDPKYTDHSPDEIASLSEEAIALEMDLWLFAKRHLGA